MGGILTVESVTMGRVQSALDDVVRVSAGEISERAITGEWDAVVVDDTSVPLDELRGFVASVTGAVVFVDRDASGERKRTAEAAGVAEYLDASTTAPEAVAAAVARVADVAHSSVDTELSVAATAFVETVSDPAYVLDGDGRFIAINDAGASLVGIPRDHLIGRKSDAIAAPGHVASIEERLDEAEGTVDVDFDIQVGDRDVPVTARVTAYELPDGSRGRVGVIEDRRDADHFEQELSNVMDRVTDAFFALDTEWRFTYLNQTASRLLERGTDELLGRNVWEEFEPAVGTAFQAKYERAMETQEPVTFTEYYPPLEAWFSVTAYPSETGLSVYFRDVTEEREMREELERERKLNQRIVETTPVGILVYTEEGEIRIGNERASELLGAPPSEIVPLRETPEFFDAVDENGEQLELSDLPAQVVLESGEPVFDRIVGVRGSTGERRWLSVNAAPFDPPGEDRDRQVVVAIRDITERYEYQLQLDALNESLRPLFEVESTAEICDIAVDAAEERFNFSDPAVALYDEETGGLSVEAGGSPSTYPESLFDSRESASWRAYTSDESAVADGDGFAVPISGYGVLLSRSEASESTVGLASAFASYVTAALDRVDREQSLREQRDTLAEQNRVLERAERVNTIIRQVVRQLTNANSRREIEEGVCMELATVDPYQLAWIGHVDTTAGVTLAATAGVGQDSIDESALEDADVLHSVVHEGRVHSIADLAGDPPLPDWRAAATRQGFRSCCLTPIRSGESTIGVLAVYAADVDAFSETEVAVLEELGSVVGYAIGAVQRKRALAGGELIEVTYEIESPDDDFLAFAARAGEDFTFEGSVQSDDGSLRAFATVPESIAAGALSTLDAGGSVVDVDRIGATTNDDVRVSVTFSGDSFFDALLDAGVVVSEIEHASSSGVRLTVTSPPGVDVSATTSRLREFEPNASLVRRRERTRSLRDQSRLPSVVANQLTPRQREVVETAFRAGYFDQPRRVTGRELAEMLDVSQPTVNRHIRAAEHALLEAAFGEPD